jgi:hypothetical protein
MARIAVQSGGLVRSSRQLKSHGGEPGDALGADAQKRATVMSAPPDPVATPC